MPLTWDSSETALDNTNEADLTLREAGIFATMAVGIQHITRENCLDFYKRVTLWEKVSGAYRFKAVDGKAEPHFFSAEDVVRLIGLRTNASTKTKAQFNKSVVESHERWAFPWDFKMPLDTPVEA